MTTPGPAGWYDDPQDSNTLRYWDGKDWTGRLKQKPIPRSPSPPDLPPPLPTAGRDVPESASWDAPRTPASSTVTIRVIVAVALIIAGGFLGSKLLFANSDGHQSPGSSDEDQIKALVQTWTTDLNNRDLAGLSSLMCSGSQLPRNPFYTRDKIGPLSSSASDIDVDGNRASATIVSTWSNGTHNRETDTFGKENGSWKICHTVNF